MNSSLPQVKDEEENFDPLQISVRSTLAELALNTMLISEGIYLSDQLGREVTADEVRERSVPLSTPG